MNDALIGYTGYIGSILQKQTLFQSFYRSTNINEIANQSFDTVVCAGAPGQKWLANSDPQSDRLKINNLIENLKNIKCKTFVLISTIDVFKNPLNVDENTVVQKEDLAAYGLHRRLLEEFVASNFKNYLIVRLPGLVGPGLRKNVIFDFLNTNNFDKIESRGIFQFYPMVNLWYDIQIALVAKLKIIHLTAAPISVADVSEFGFGKFFKNHLSNAAASYDMRTCHSHLFGYAGNYQYSLRESIQAIRSYAQSEPKSNLKPEKMS